MSSIRKTPDEVMAEILVSGPRPQKARNLQAMHELCKALYEIGPRDFSLSNIGKLCEAKGIFRARGLYNEAAADYRLLVEAWAHLAGPLPPKIVDSEKSSEAYVSQIKDPVIRMLVKRDIAKLNRVTAELNVLKGSKTILIDRRPTVQNSQPLIGSSVKRLEDSELTALQTVISERFLKGKGWAETSLGEIVNESGKMIFPPGFCSGIRKLLGEI